MARLQPMIPVDEILSKMEDLERRLSQNRGEGPPPSRKEAAPPCEKAPAAKEPAMDTAPAAEETRPVSGEDLWESFKGFVKKKSYPLWSKIEPGQFLGYQERTLRMGFPEGYLFLEYFKEKEQKDRLTEFAREFFREDVIVKIESLKAGNPGTGNQETENTAAQNNRAGDIRREALNHPILQKVMDVFEGAEVREVIVRYNHT